MEIQKIIIRNKKTIEPILKKLLMDLKKYSFSLYDLIFDNPQQYKLLRNLIFKNPYINKHYDTESIIQILDYTYRKNADIKASDFIADFEQNIRDSFNEWVVLFPLDFNELGFSNYDNVRRRIDIGKYMIYPPRKNRNLLASTIKNKFKTTKIDLNLVDHCIRTAGEFIIKNPILCFTLHGSIGIVQYRCLDYFRYFRWIQDLFLSFFNDKNEFFNELQPLNHHFFLLNIKSGKFRRFTLWESSKILGSLDKNNIKNYKRHALSYYTNLIFQNPQNKLFKRIFNSLLFFSKGFNEDDSISKFIFYIVSMESLFSRDKHTPLRTNLADCISLLCYKKNKRLEMHQNIKNIYDLRSGIIHSGKHYVSQETIEQTEKFASASLMESLKLYRSLSNLANPDNAYFNKLLEYKLK